MSTPDQRDHVQRRHQRLRHWQAVAARLESDRGDAFERTPGQPDHVQRRHQRLRKEQPGAARQADLITYNAGPELAAERDAALRAGDERHQLQRHDQRSREGQATRASLGLVPEMRCSQLEPDVISYSAAPSACAKG